MYRAGLESILGLRRRGATFAIDPCIPSSWPEYPIAWRFGADALRDHGRRTRSAAAAASRRRRWTARRSIPRAIPLVDDGGTHEVRLVLGARKRTPSTAVKEGAPAPA